METRETFINIFGKEIDNAIKSLINNKPIDECENLNNKIYDSNFELNAKALPMYFTGNLESKIIFVELNPGNGLNVEIKEDGIVLEDFPMCGRIIKDIDSYINYFQNFGTCKVEDIKNKNKNKSIPKFDKRQLAFFEGFGLNFLKDKEFNYSLDDIENIRNNKLQLEIVPYPSKKFNFSNFDQDYIKERFNKIFDFILKTNAEIIFITGNKQQIKNVIDNKSMKVEFMKNKIESNNVQKNVNIAITEIKNKKLIFIPTYKSRYILSSENLLYAYGELCKNEAKIGEISL
ncbi:MAG: hypothetical protein WHS63_10220 [Tenuifilum sp.]|uniref:hypothetical protein n=1 Tax=Tenuifilum sp. TaxID=2760880 RepID=UPI0030A00E35